MNKNIVIPAILENNFLEIENQIKNYSKLTTHLQIDICDGVYVKSKTWQPNVDEDIDGYLLDLEFDMMITKENLEDYLKFLFLYDAKKIIIHIGSMSNNEYKSFYKKIKNRNKLISVGLALNHFDEVSRVENNLECLDFVQIMGIENIGSQRNPFDKSCLDKIRLVKNIFIKNNMLEKYIQIDGAMNTDTVKLCKESGAKNFVVGSFLKDSSDKKYNFTLLKNI